MINLIFFKNNKTHVLSSVLYLVLTLSSVDINKHACVCVCMLSRVWLFVTPRPADGQAPLFMEFSRQEYWSGWPFPTPGYFPDPSLFLQNLSPEQGVSHHHSPRLRLRAHRGVGRALVGKRESMSYSERVMWGSRRQAGRKRAVPGDCLDDRFGFPHLVLNWKEGK